MRALALIALLLLASPVLAQQGIEKGQEIAVRVPIQNTGSIDLNGFSIEVTLVDPNNKMYVKTLNFTDVLKPGQSRTYELRTEVTADVVGTWWVTTILRTLDGAPLSFDLSAFEVGPEQAIEARIQIDDVVGYAIVASVGVLVALAIARFLV